MKIQIVSERRMGILKPSPSGLGWFRSVYYVIKRCTIDRKDIHVTSAEIETCGGVNPYYGSRSRPRKQQTLTTLTLKINGEIKTYEVLKYSGKQEGDIRTINLEVRREYKSIKDLVQNCTPEQLKKLQKAFNDYLVRTGSKPIPFSERE